MSKFNIFSTSIFEQLGENNIPKLSSEGKKDRWGTQKREVWQQSTILTFSKIKNERIENYDHLKRSLFFISIL